MQYCSPCWFSKMLGISRVEGEVARNYCTKAESIHDWHSPVRASPARVLIKPTVKMGWPLLIDLRENPKLNIQEVFAKFVLHQRWVHGDDSKFCRQNGMHLCPKQKVSNNIQQGTTTNPRLAIKIEALPTKSLNVCQSFYEASIVVFQLVQ